MPPTDKSPKFGDGDDDDDDDDDGSRKWGGKKRNCHRRRFRDELPEAGGRELSAKFSARFCRYATGNSLIARTCIRRPNLWPNFD